MKQIFWEDAKFDDEKNYNKDAKIQIVKSRYKKIIIIFFLTQKLKVLQTNLINNSNPFPSSSKFPELRSSSSWMKRAPTVIKIFLNEWQTPVKFYNR